MTVSKSTGQKGTCVTSTKNVKSPKNRYFVQEEHNSKTHCTLPRNALSKATFDPRNEGSFTSTSSTILPIQHSSNESIFNVHAGDFIHMTNMLPIGTTVKGKQRIKKRKKVLSPLKKHILKERLLQWQKRQGLVGSNDIGVGPTAVHDVTADSLTSSPEDDLGVYSNIVYIENYALLNELEDDDEYEEIVDNLKSLSEEIGVVSSVHVPRYVKGDEQELNSNPLVYVRFESMNDAIAAKACWNGMTFGGNQVFADIVPTCLMNETYGVQAIAGDWKRCAEAIPYRKLVEKNKNISLQAPTRTTAKNETAVVILSNILTRDDLEDDECLEETLQDVRKLALTYGPLVKEGSEGITVDKSQKVIVIRYKDMEHTIVAAAKLNGSILGGAKIYARIEKISERNSERLYTVHLDNILCEDDYEDEDCLEATKEDIKVLAMDCGSPLKVDVHVDGKDKGRMSISYSTKECACCAVSKFNGMIIGGKSIQAWMESISTCSDDDSAPLLELRNVLNDEDYEDEECLQETKEDLFSMIQHYGEIKHFHVETTGRNRGVVTVAFVDSNRALQACEKLNGTVVGGARISANISCRDDSSSISSPSKPKEMISNNQTVLAPEPMYSGDKVIPEQYAECKRVPKIPNPGVPREYAKRIDDSSVIPLLFDMLGELMRFKFERKKQ
jgi:RNA-binding proteins (RRM domain)